MLILIAQADRMPPRSDLDRCAPAEGPSDVARARAKFLEALLPYNELQS